MEVTCSKCGTKNILVDENTSICKSCQAEIFYTTDVSETVIGEKTTSSHAENNTREIPEQFGRYKVMEEIGRGGMGVVYKGYDTTLKRNVALKILLYIEDSALKRFLLEAQTMASLDHNNIIKVYDVGQQDGLPYIVMDLIAGTSLRDHLKTNTLDQKKAAAMMQKIAIAMNYAHNKGVIHRDLKPANIMLKGEEPIIMDFGLAKLQQSQLDLSKTGSIMGTFLYMSPEQANGVNVDERTDIYAMGSILYEILAGKPPFESDTTFSLINKILNEKPGKITSYSKDISVDLEKICMCALEKDTSERYPSALDFANDIENFLNDKKIVSKKTIAIKKTRPVLPKEYFAIAIALILLTIVMWLSVSATGQKTLEYITQKIFISPPPGWSDDLWQEVWQKNYIDFTTEKWAFLPHEKQIQYAQSYQKWYADLHGLQVEKKEKITTERGTAEFDFVLVPPGKFWMGSPEDEWERNEDEKRHKVLISKAFWIGKYEVTQGQWRALVEHPQNYLGDNQPLYIVSWNKSKEFCENVGFALPSEAQWEYACRAGTTSTFNMGDNIDAKYVNYNGSMPYKVDTYQKYRWNTTEVGSLKNGNSWGCYDMHGNIQEWCLDDYVEYNSEEQKDPVVINNLGVKVYRGGGRYTAGSSCRSAFRTQVQLEYEGANLGFRVILPFSENK